MNLIILHVQCVCGGESSEGKRRLSGSHEAPNKAFMALYTKRDCGTWPKGLEPAAGGQSRDGNEETCGGK